MRTQRPPGPSVAVRYRFAEAVRWQAVLLLGVTVVLGPAYWWLVALLIGVLALVLGIAWMIVVRLDRITSEYRVDKNGPPPDRGNDAPFPIDSPSMQRDDPLLIEVTTSMQEKP